MPAIQPARLRQQAAKVAEHFNDPPAYTRSLHNLLEFYADRTRRPGQSGKPDPLITAYNIPPPVLRLVLQESLAYRSNDPQASLALCDALWEQSYLEFRLLAIMLLSQVPPDPPDAITSRVNTWLTKDLDEQLVDRVLTDALMRLRQEDTATLLELIQDWIKESDVFFQQIALRAILPLIQDPDFENLPAFYNMLQPLVRRAPRTLRPDLLEVLGALAQRSPQETASFLRFILGTPEAIDTPWIIRQTLHQFPGEIKDHLRDTVRALE